MCLSCLSVGLPSTAEDSTEAGGVTATLTLSAVAQLEQCKFIKENKRRNSGQAKILRGFQHAPRVRSWKQSVDYAVDGSHFNVQMPPLRVWQWTESGNVTMSDLCQAKTFSWHTIWIRLNNNLMSQPFAVISPSIIVKNNLTNKCRKQ